MPELPCEDLKKLTEELRDLRATVQKSISFKQVIVRGLLSGIATAIGATIIATFVILILLRLLQSIGLSDWFESSGLQPFLDRATNEQPKP